MGYTAWERRVGILGIFAEAARMGRRERFFGEWAERMQRHVQERMNQQGWPKVVGTIAYCRDGYAFPVDQSTWKWEQGRRVLGTYLVQVGLQYLTGIGFPAKGCTLPTLGPREYATTDQDSQGEPAYYLVGLEHPIRHHRRVDAERTIVRFSLPNASVVEIP